MSEIISAGCVCIPLTWKQCNSYTFLVLGAINDSDQLRQYTSILNGQDRVIFQGKSIHSQILGKI